MRRYTAQELEFWTNSFEHKLKVLGRDVIKPAILRNLAAEKTLMRSRLEYSIVSKQDRQGKITEFIIEQGEENPDLDTIVSDIVKKSIRFSEPLPSSYPSIIEFSIYIYQAARQDPASCDVKYHDVYSPLVQLIYERTRNLFSTRPRPRIGVILNTDGTYNLSLFRSCGQQDHDEQIISKIKDVCSELCDRFPYDLIGEQRFGLSSSPYPHLPIEFTDKMLDDDQTEIFPSDIIDWQEGSTSLDLMYDYGLQGNSGAAQRITVPCINVGCSSTRMLPDARDSFTPLQRRIVYSMLQAELVFPSKASADSIVKSVFDNYHPEFPSPIYNVLLRMANSQICRYPLIDSDGNTGDLDNDAAAAGFVDVGLSLLATQSITDLEHNTIDYVGTIYGIRKEPSCLPTRLPVLLMNGVGHSYLDDLRIPRIPPHNLAELCDAILAKIENPELSSTDLLEWCKGPDFPLGGTIVNGSDLPQIYESGTGTVLLRGDTKIDESGQRRGRITCTTITITSLPFMIGPEMFTNKVVDLLKNEEMRGISDVTDETDRNGVRVVIELKRDANPREILADLIRQTPLQIEVPVNMLVMSGSDYQPFIPKVVSLAELIQNYIDYQMLVCTRRIRFYLHNTYLLLPDTKELAEGTIVDEIIWESDGRNEESVRKLVQELGISKDRANAVVIYHSAGSELEERLAQAQDSIRSFGSPKEAAEAYEEMLANDSKLREIIKSQIVELRNNFGDKRRTKIILH